MQKVHLKISRNTRRIYFQISTKRLTKSKEIQENWTRL